MQKSSKIIFFGNERLSTGFELRGAPTLQALIDNGYHVAAVVAHFEPGRSRGARELEVQQVAEQHDIPVLLPDKLSEVADQLAALHADIGVLIAYGKLVPESIISLFPNGIINIHPSLLPQYRGSTPIEQAILDGAPKTGVSLMQLAKAMDAGPVYAQAEVSLHGTETKQDLTEQLLHLGGELLIEHLPAILDGTLHPAPQDESRATFTQLINKDQGWLDLNLPAIQLERMVRAYAGWPKSRVHVHGHDIVVLATRVAGSATDGSLVLGCGQNTFLEITQLIAPSGRRVSGADFVRGYQKAA